MWLQHQRGRVHFKKEGYTLIELIAALAMMIIVCSIVMGGYRQRIEKAKFEQTVEEMMSLAQASRDFYKSKGYWPATPGDLAGTFMYSYLDRSPLGAMYQISNVNQMVTISTRVPSGLAEKYYQGTFLVVSPGDSNDIVSITQCLSNGLSGRLEYAKKYTY